MVELHALIDTVFGTQSALSAFASGSSSRSSGDAVYLLLLGPLAGIGFYTMTYLRYRNTDKRYEYERKTSSEVADAKGFDQRVGQITGTQEHRIQGDNARAPRMRLGQGTSIRHDY